MALFTQRSPAEILALPLFKVASISHSRRGVAMQTRFSVITTVPELLVLWSSPHSGASLTLRTSTQSVLACTNRARMSEIQAIWVNFERESRFPKLLKIIETKVGNGAVWTESLCAHGRCATRLRYAPTLLLH
jgi:hypothetical protein